MDGRRHVSAFLFHDKHLPMKCENDHTGPERPMLIYQALTCPAVGGFG
jgi:hypothetical protein